jgi:hypothetical protein
MPKFNEDIALWMGNSQNEQRTFYAFKGQKQDKAIEGLLKRMMWPNRFKYPIARVYVRTELHSAYVQGNKVNNIKDQELWYGPGISSFKIKMILEDGENSQVGPFYSNSTIADAKMQLETLVYEYCALKYPKFISAIIYDLRNNDEKLVAKAKLINEQIKLKYTELWKK